MIAPTHIAFAVACGTVGGAPTWALPLLMGGSLLPDIDHPQSFLGRVFFFCSIPLNKWFGHRRTIHGFALWGVVALAGFFLWQPIMWLALGSLSHVFIDLLNIAGVHALLPFSEKVCVLFSRNWRFPVGSRNELMFLVIVGLFAWGGAYIGSIGGFRALIGVLTNAHGIAYDLYLGMGQQVCFFEGVLRHRDGRLEEGSWLVIGQEGMEGLAVWDKERDKLIHTPEQAEFLRARLRPTDQSWQTMALTGWARTNKEAFFYDGKKWHYARAGAIVYGWILGRELDVVTLQPDSSTP